MDTSTELASGLDRDIAALKAKARSLGQPATNTTLEVSQS